MNKEAFGKFIADTRRDLGMTQQTLANLLHVTDKAVSKWERGLCYPDLTLIEDLATALELTPAELMACRKDVQQSSAADERSMYTPCWISPGRPSAVAEGKCGSPCLLLS